jgi:tetratricopeptide (TPR) repeat protein
MLEEALKQSKAALPVFQKYHDGAGVATQLYNLGVIHENLDNILLAWWHYKLALERHHAAGDRYFELEDYIAIAQMELKLGMSNAANFTLCDAMDVANEIGDTERANGIDRQLEYLLENDDKDRLDHLLDAATKANELGDRHKMFELCLAIGLHYSELDSAENASGYLELALKYRPATFGDESRAVVLEIIAKFYQQLQKFDEALPLYEEIESIHTVHANMEILGSIIAQHGNVLISQGKHEEALERYHAAHQILSDIGKFQDDFTNMLNIASTWSTIGDHEQARAVYSEALALAPQIGMPEMQGEVLYYLGEELLASGKREEAVQHLERAIASGQEHGMQNVVDAAKALLESIGKAT